MVSGYSWCTRATMYCHARHGNFVAGVATKTIHAAAAPDQEHFGEFIPERDVVVFKFDEVLPRDAPGARTGEVALWHRAGTIRDGFPASAIPSRCG